MSDTQAAPSRSFPDGVQIAPSILSADFSSLGSQVGEVMDAGARVVHVDVMDGHFVPPITIGPLVCASIADQVHDAGGFVDVHLMIEQPSRQVEEFARAGADCISVHLEADPHLHRTLGAIRDAGCLAGVALNPGTPASRAAAVDALADLLLCMTVNPGWGGQAFIPGSENRIFDLTSAYPQAVVEVDGGVDARTAPAVVAAGARVLVAGSAVFGASDPGAAYAEIATAAANAS